MMMDITARKQAEEALRQSRDFLKHLTSAVPDAIFAVKMPERTIIWANDSFNVMGYEPDEYIGQTTKKFYVNPEDYDAVGRLQQDAIRKGDDMIRTEVMVLRKDGRVIPAELTATYYREGGKLSQITAFVRDISERKQAEKKILDYQQRLKALASQLTIAEEKERRAIAAALHDHVGQSLALARIQLASARKSTSDSKLADKLDDISDTLIESLEDTQKLMLELSSPTMHELGLSSAISEWLEVQIESRHGLKTEFIANIPDNRRKMLDSDIRTILFRNVRELVVNVVKHARANKVRVRLEDRSPSIRIIVEDDGIGFDPRATTQAGIRTGGFGLFSVEELMADLGGSLRIVSEPGKGCTAILSAPFIVNDSRGRD
jgi:PAS domain S-box-containing protein